MNRPVSHGRKTIGTCSLLLATHFHNKRHDNVLFSHKQVATHVLFPVAALWGFTRVLHNLRELLVAHPDSRKLHLTWRRKALRCLHLNEKYCHVWVLVCVRIRIRNFLRWWGETKKCWFVRDDRETRRCWFVRDDRETRRCWFVRDVAWLTRYSCVWHAAVNRRVDKMYGTNAHWSCWYVRETITCEHEASSLSLQRYSVAPAATCHTYACL